MARALSFAVLIVIIVVIGILFYQVMVGFFIPLFLAALLVVIFRPLHERMLAWCRGYTHVAAFLTTMAILLIVLVPTGLILTVGAVQATRAVSRIDGSDINRALIRLRRSIGLEIPHRERLSHLDAVHEEMGLGTPAEEIPPMVHEMARELDALERERQTLDDPAPLPSAVRLREALVALERQAEAAPRDVPAAGHDGLDDAVLAADRAYRDFRRSLLGGPMWAELVEAANPREEDVERLAAQSVSAAQPRLLKAAGGAGGFLARAVIGVVILVIAVFFFLADGPTMIRTLMDLSPLDDRYEHQLLDEFDRVTRAVLLAMVLSAAAQGLLAAFGYWLAGLESVVMLMMLTTLIALIPFLGAAAVWIPCCLWLGLVENRWLAALLLALWGAFVVSTSDNVIKALILHGRSRLHPLLALLSVLGGVAVFGPVGILVGPMIVVFLQTLLEILNRELREGGLVRSRGGGGTTSHPPVTRLVRLAGGRLPRGLK